MKKIVFLASGNGGTIKFLHQAIQTLDLDLSITGVIADRSCGAIDYAQAHHIPNSIISYSRTAPQALQNALTHLSPDLIITNFHKIIDEETLNLFPGKFINLHYSLLPAFGGMIGMETLNAAKKANAKFVGASCHQVIPEVDAGQLLCQSAIPVQWDTVNEDNLMNAVFQSACLVFLNSILGSDKPVERIQLSDHTVFINPGLSFPIDAFNDALWELVRRA